MVGPRAGYPPPKHTAIEIVNGIGRHRFVEKTRDALRIVYNLYATLAHL
jgi:hypothetical protein